MLFNAVARVISRAKKRFVIFLEMEKIHNLNKDPALCEDWQDIFMCSKLRVHHAPCVHILAAGCTDFVPVHPVCA